MSHTYANGNTTFFANSDLSGDVKIKNSKGELEVKGLDLENFILDHLKDEFIRQLEETSGQGFKDYMLRNYVLKI